MRTNCASSVSPWLGPGLTTTPALRADATADVCIVGAGIAGLLTAESLTRAGLSVVILESGSIAGGETSRTTAHLVSALDDRYTQLERMHGERGAALAAQSHSAAIDHLEGVAKGLEIDCGFKRLDGYLVVNERHHEEASKLLDEELAACRRAGLGDVERVRELPAGWPAHEDGALRFPRQAQLDPLRFMNGLAEQLMKRGVRIYCDTHVAKVQGGSDAHVVTRQGPVVRSRHIVVATNTPVNDLLTIHTKQAGYQTYVIALQLPPQALAPGLLWDGLWGDDEAYHYVRVARGPAGEADVLIVGGEDHKTGQEKEDHDPYERLEAWTRDRFPAAGLVLYRWSGIVMEPVDGLGYIGHNPLDRDNVYVATGDSGNGMTHGAIAGLLISDLIQGRSNPWEALYQPNRKVGLTALGDYARENLNMAKQYSDWLKKGTVESVAEVPNGGGAIISRGIHKLAVYKDSRGNCTVLNARCPHLGGVVRWNACESTWDCPCHASRFSAVGRVIHGPAISDLEAATVEVRPVSAPVPPAV